MPRITGTKRDGQILLARPAGQGDYVAEQALVDAINAALILSQPLLITGEPGTGKTTLAAAIAHELQLEAPLKFFTRSDHTSRDLLYSYDHMRRFYHAQVKDPRVEQAENYLTLESRLGEAFLSEQLRVFLIDEIDKAPRDFCNDLLNEMERMEFVIPEVEVEDPVTHKRRPRVITARQRPFLLITSNSERQLPDPFLRRCVFHHIKFPDRQQLEAIVSSHFGEKTVSPELVSRALDCFLALREDGRLTKKPATSELLGWVRILVSAGLDPSRVRLEQLPYPGALMKHREDLQQIAGR